ncbi:hypothetical protein HLRTI_002910 [Halorhabdus tiamatea SARL4B]|uniref:Uncharacterized protein n=1 Tax=Halorhabdus tiamatea SARL4B TaxID=1033806 RepID=U2DZ97_9EURY|nr:hypothetical protein [Halorhabdus tiamatea]ERJ05111.1 hypothetical protein HLRTI_002910 [Halorhabdus tiamatea SARL4B]
MSENNTDDSFESHAVEADATLSTFFQARDPEDAIEQFEDATGGKYVDVEVGDVTMVLHIENIRAEVDK